MEKGSFHFVTQAFLPNFVFSYRKRKNYAHTTVQTLNKANKPSPSHSKATHFKGRRSGDTYHGFSGTHITPLRRTALPKITPLPKVVTTSASQVGGQLGFPAKHLVPAWITPEFLREVGWVPCWDYIAVQQLPLPTPASFASPPGVDTACAGQQTSCLQLSSQSCLPGNLTCNMTFPPNLFLF